VSVDLPSGAVIEYPYLWRWQRARGETEGRKTRPVCVAISVRSQDGFTHLALLAISSRPAAGDQTALEVPEIECRRGGLSEWKRAWVTVSEYNYDIAERSYYLNVDQPPLGRFTRPFMMRLATAFAPLFQRGRARVDRSE
jgi:hypothetical protein